MSSTHLKLGTRRSLLAWAQSSWVARQLEKLNPGLQVELVGIDTRGDKILDIPLQSVEGKEFFVAELDDALRNGGVDLTVHSMKDLSTERPSEFVLGAVPLRENPRDVILFGPEVIEKIRAGKTLKIGTSSPRRQENIPAFLERALPKVGSSRARVELVEIRGNVNTRLGRVHEPVGSERALDAVVLAFAGLIRLWADQPGREALTRLLEGVRWMVLPLRECPAAPAQGALAIECRAKDEAVRKVLATLHDAATAAHAQVERQLLVDWGGGCHQRFGATAVRSREAGDLLWIRGRKTDGTFVEELRWQAPASVGIRAEDCWDGSRRRDGSEASSSTSLNVPLIGRSVFVAHSRALPEGTETQRSRVWTSGVSSWFRLAERGVWVEGCAESLGIEFVQPTLREAVLRLADPWVVLTHETATDGWPGVEVVATYRVPDSKIDAEELSRLKQAKVFYWSSGSQYDQFGSNVSTGAKHCCGPGKTAAHLREHGVEPIVFPSSEEWRKWLQLK